nr:hypothetical protein [uncultured Selenomonas sp.]
MFDFLLINLIQYRLWDIDEQDHIGMKLLHRPIKIFPPLVKVTLPPLMKAEFIQFLLGVRTYFPIRLSWKETHDMSHFLKRLCDM